MQRQVQGNIAMSSGGSVRLSRGGEIRLAVFAEEARAHAEVEGCNHRDAADEQENPVVYPEGGEVGHPDGSGQAGA